MLTYLAARTLVHLDKAECRSFKCSSQIRYLWTGALMQMKVMSTEMSNFLTNFILDEMGFSSPKKICPPKIKSEGQCLVTKPC